MLAELCRRATSLEEIHLSHNRFTGDGVTRIIQAAERSRPHDAVPLWLRLEHNDVADPAALFKSLEKKYSICERLDKRKCTNRVCGWGKKVHLPLFSLQRSAEQKRRNGDEAENWRESRVVLTARDENDGRADNDHDYHSRNGGRRAASEWDRGWSADQRHQQGSYHQASSSSRYRGHDEGYEKRRVPSPPGPARGYGESDRRARGGPVPPEAIARRRPERERPRTPQPNGRAYDEAVKRRRTEEAPHRPAPPPPPRSRTSGLAQAQDPEDPEALSISSSETKHRHHDRPRDRSASCSSSSSAHQPVVVANKRDDDVDSQGPSASDHDNEALDKPQQPSHGVCVAAFSDERSDPGAEWD